MDTLAMGAFALVGVLAIAVVVYALSGSSTTKTKTIVAPTTSPVPATPSTTPPTSARPTSAAPAIGQPYEVDGPDGAFSITIEKQLLNVIKSSGDPTVRVLGVLVTLSPISGAPTVQPRGFAITPSTFSVDHDGTARPDEGSVDIMGIANPPPYLVADEKAACMGLPTLVTSAMLARAADPASGSLVLDSSRVQHSFTGCLTFSFTGQPNAIVYGNIDSPFVPVVSWPISLPR